MIITKDLLKIAVVQAAPIMFDKEKCTDKAVALIEECRTQSAILRLRDTAIS